MLNKYTYYLNFTTVQFLGGKELLKSMPVFFNKVYFCKKYANALWTGDIEEQFSNIALICKKDDISNLRQIIKNNFLYLNDWDSLKYGDEDYGFSFIAGNIKYILMPFSEVETGYDIRYYDVDNYTCFDTHVDDDKKFFLDSSINENGEFVNTCQFNIEDMNDSNTKKKIAPRKSMQPEIAVYERRGYVLANVEYIIGILLSTLVIAWILYLVMKFLSQANI